MSRRQQLLLLCGCAFVLALEVPRTLRQVPLDLAGPYARPSAPAEVLAAGDGGAVSVPLGPTPLPRLERVARFAADEVAAADR